MSLGAADYLTQLPSLGPVGQWAYDRLIQLTIENTQLRGQIQQKDAALRESQVALQRLQEQIEEAQRKAHRQAAPFRRPDEQRKARPARPGRKCGHPGAYRRKPDHIDQSVSVPLKDCPHCHGQVQHKRPVTQYIEEAPVVRPIVTELITEQGWCAPCQKEVYSTHPLQTSRAEGAAQVQLGPRALGLAADLRAKGLSMRKTVAVLEQHFGLKLTPGGLALALQRLGRRVAADYDQLPDLLRKSAVVHADDTSWWVGQPGWWLHVFTTSETTCYVVAQGRAAGVTLNILGDQFAGTLVTDCASVYDDLNPSQQKCYSHHLKAVAEACKTHPQQGEGYLHQIQALLRTAIVLKALQESADRQRFELCVNQLKARAQALLLETPRPQVEEEKVRKRLWKQRDHLFTFLERVDVPATNNLAERQLRPAVIARKVSCGNKTPRGAEAWARLTSMAATCQQRGEDFVDFIAERVRLEPTRGP